MLIASRHPSGPVRRGKCPEMFKLGFWWSLVYSHFSEMKTTYRVSRARRGPWRVSRVPGIVGRSLYPAKSLPQADRRMTWGPIYERGPNKRFRLDLWWRLWCSSSAEQLG